MTFFKIYSGRIISTVLMFLYTIMSTNADGISCFKCYPSQPGYEETDLLCSQFDGSAKFQVFCPSSSLCMKKTIHYKIKTSVITAVQRDCAPQKRTVYTYSDVNNTWHNKEEIVKTAYEEGCFIGEDRGTPADPPEYCFCSFHVCNSSKSFRITHIYHSILLALMVLSLRLIENFIMLEYS